MFDNGVMNDADRRQPPQVRQWRNVRNEHWPEAPMTFRRRDDPLPVRARVIWDKFGEEYVEGIAVRWDTAHVYVEIDDRRRVPGGGGGCCRCGGTHIYVEIDDRRLTTNGVWLKPSDVYRRTPPPTG